MPRPKSQPSPSDRAFCERTCRVAGALGWRLQEETLGDGFAFRFHAPNGREVVGHAFAERDAALTHACRKLAESLV